jgi:serine/threonine-protein kinase
MAIIRRLKVSRYLTPLSNTLRDELQRALGTAYTLDRELSGGGMSRVFVARDVALGRTVVVKVLAPELIEGLSIERFTREIKLAAALQEPHIVPVLAAGSTPEGLPYYTMPFVEGESLRVRLQAGRVPVAEALSILRDVAKALAYAHARHIVHRDVKPENILLSSGTAVVTDFGIAKALQLSRTQAPDGAASAGITRTGTSIGTPAYMAPEQAAGDPNTDQRADIYAWGVIAYELLAGKHPFAEKTTPQQLLTAHMAETPVSLATTGSQASREVMALVMRCLAKDPAERPESAAEVLAVLDGMVTQPSGTLVARRSRRALFVVTATVLVSAAAFATYWGRGEQRADATRPIMIAVLPFEHAGPAEQEAFTAGLTDALTAKLGALTSIAVIDRQSASQYRGTTKPMKQIGAELGVKYLVVGVVRWAADGSGNSRTRVTPTLVDAETGATKWTGDAVDIALNDPFAAQTTIATDVAKRLQVALNPENRASLKSNLSDNPEALAAFQRALGILEEAERRSRDDDPAVTTRYAAQVEIATRLDSTFGDAWGELAAATSRLASIAPQDSSAQRRWRATFASAVSHAPENPLVLLLRAGEEWRNDTSKAIALVDRAVQRAPKRTGVLIMASRWLIGRGLRDSGYALARSARELDPRSLRRTLEVAQIAYALGKWDDAFDYGSKLVALDSTDQRGWVARMMVSRSRGDTATTMRDLKAAVRLSPDASAMLSQHMLWAGDADRARFLQMSVRELGITTLYDSANSYYDNKLYIAVSMRDSVRIRNYADSLRKLLQSRPLPYPYTGVLGVLLAGAQGVAGDPTASRRSIEQAIAFARKYSKLDPPVDQLDGTLVAGVYARLREPETAVRWLEAALPRYASVKGLLLDPRLQLLNGTPAFERFLQAHPR